MAVLDVARPVAWSLRNAYHTRRVLTAGDGAGDLQVLDDGVLDVGKGSYDARRCNDVGGDGMATTVEATLERMGRCADRGSNGDVAGQLQDQFRVRGQFAVVDGISQRGPVGGVTDEVGVVGRSRAIPGKCSLGCCHQQG